MFSDSPLCVQPEGAERSDRLQNVRSQLCRGQDREARGGVCQDIQQEAQAVRHDEGQGEGNGRGQVCDGEGRRSCETDCPHQGKNYFYHKNKLMT